jgi:hypothetical protein
MVPLAELLSTLSPAALRAFVSAFGPIPGLAANATPLAAAKFLFVYPAAYPSAAPADGTPRLPTKHARFLLSVLPRFGTEGGRSAFVEAGRALGDTRVDAWLATNAVDVAVHLAAEQATTKGAAHKRARLLFALAGLRLDRDLPERPTVCPCRAPSCGRRAGLLRARDFVRKRRLAAGERDLRGALQVRRRLDARELR